MALSYSVNLFFILFQVPIYVYFYPQGLYLDKYYVDGFLHFNE